MFRPKKVCIVATNHPRLETLCTNWHGMRRGLERLKIPYDFVSCRPTLEVQEVIDSNADLIVYGLRDMISNKEWRDEIRNKCPNAKIVVWYGDLRTEETTQILADCSELDAMFISNDGQEEFYKKQWQVKEVYFLPLGCEPIEKPVFDKRFAFDFVFIGGQISGKKFEERAKFIQECRDGLNLKLVNSFNSETRAKIHEAMPAIYSSSKITLDISHFTDILRYTSNRYWIIPAFYGFPLTKRFPKCEEFYPEETRAYFDTFEELEEKISFYHRYESERVRLIKAGHKHSFNHTYDNRWLEMFRKL